MKLVSHRTRWILPPAPPRGFRISRDINPCRGQHHVLVYPPPCTPCMHKPLSIHCQPPSPPSRRSWRPTSRRSILPDLEGGNQSFWGGPPCGGRFVGIIPLCMALLNWCCDQKIWLVPTSPNFADSLGPSPTRGQGGGGADCACVPQCLTVHCDCPLPCSAFNGEYVLNVHQSFSNVFLRLGLFQHIPVPLGLNESIS